MGIPVDTTRSIVICGGSPEAMVDRSTGQPRTDATGAQLWRLWLVLIGDDEPVVMRVKTPKEPKGLVKGQPVNVAGLVASNWTTPDGKDVDLYNAVSVDPARTAREAS